MTKFPWHFVRDFHDEEFSMFKSVLTMIMMILFTSIISAQTPTFGASSTVGSGPSFTCNTSASWQVQTFADVEQVECESKIKIYDDQGQVIWTQNLGLWRWNNEGTSGVVDTQFDTAIDPEAPEGLVKVHVNWSLRYSHSGQTFGLTDNQVVATWVRF